MEKYCKKIKEWVMKIVNYEMKEMIPLTRDEKEHHDNDEEYYDKKDKNFKTYKKVRDH